MFCPYCGSDDTYGSTLRGALHRCNGCGEYFDPDGPNDTPEDEPQGETVRLFEPAPAQMPGQEFFALEVEPLPARTVRAVRAGQFHCRHCGTSADLAVPGASGDLTGLGRCRNG
jgi:transcription elongation factor Elf1